MNTGNKPERERDTDSACSWNQDPRLQFPRICQKNQYSKNRLESEHERPREDHSGVFALDLSEERNDDTAVRQRDGTLKGKSDNLEQSIIITNPLVLKKAWALSGMMVGRVGDWLCCEWPVVTPLVSNYHPINDFSTNIPNIYLWNNEEVANLGELR